MIAALLQAWKELKRGRKKAKKKNRNKERKGERGFGDEPKRTLPGTNRTSKRTNLYNPS